MTWFNLVGLPLLIRVCLVVLFPFSAMDKIFNWQGALKQANSSFLPGGPVLLVLGMSLELIGSACVVAAWHDRLAAFLLAGYCALTALLYHNFWAYPDFWAKGDSVARNHFWDFLKNFGLAGGLLLLALGTQLAPVGDVLAHPLSSTPAYASSAATPRRWADQRTGMVAGNTSVIPANAGIHRKTNLDSRVRGNDVPRKGEPPL